MKKYKLIIDRPSQLPPQAHELKAAFLLAEHFASDILFLRPGNGSTPDFKIIATSEKWELKSPLGKSRKTIENNLREARRQSQNIILDLSRCKMHDAEAISRAEFYLKHSRKYIKKLKIILKTGQIIDIL